MTDQFSLFPEQRFWIPEVDNYCRMWKCPECGKDLILRKTQKGRRYYGCEGWPECKYMSWTKPEA